MEKVTLHLGSFSFLGILVFCWLKIRRENYFIFPNDIFLIYTKQKIWPGMIGILVSANRKGRFAFGILFLNEQTAMNFFLKDKLSNIWSNSEHKYLK